MTPTSEELQRILERVEGASGPDRELECRIWCAIEGHTFYMLMAPGRSNSSWSFSYVVKGDQLPTWRDPTIYVPRYTESFDAALALSRSKFPEYCYLDLSGPRRYLNIPTPVPNRWRCQLDTNDSTVDGWGFNAALSICAALLRALIQKENGG